MRRFVCYATENFRPDTLDSRRCLESGWLYIPIFGRCPDRLVSLLKKLTGREFDGLEAVRTYLVDMVNTRQYKVFTGQIDQHNDQPLLLRRLFHDTKYWIPDSLTPNSHILVANLRYCRHLELTHPSWPENGAVHQITWYHKCLGPRTSRRWCIWDWERILRYESLSHSVVATSLPMDNRIQDTDVYNWVLRKWKADCALADKLAAEQRQREMDEYMRIIHEREAAWVRANHTKITPKADMQSDRTKYFNVFLSQCMVIPPEMR